MSLKHSAKNFVGEGKERDNYFYGVFFSFFSISDMRKYLDGKRNASLGCSKLNWYCVI